MNPIWKGAFIMNQSNFIEKTKDILIANHYDENRIATNGFRIIDSDNTKNCILVLGINPAGDENDAQAEKDVLYLYSLNTTDIQHRTYHKYHNPIFKLLSDATNNEVKWDWCNLSEDDIKKTIENDTELKKYKEIISSYYSEYKNKTYTICIGEFFYYHEKNQAEFLKLIDVRKDAYRKYYSSMLEMHINAIVEKGHNVSAILIVNATAAKNLCIELGKEEYPSCIDYKFKEQEYKIFFSSMLSGQRAIDVFSRNRLCCDLKKHLSE